MLFKYKVVFLITVIAMISRFCSAFRPFINSKQGLFRSHLSSLRSLVDKFSSSEIAIYDGGEEDIRIALNLLALKRPQLEVISNIDINQENTTRQSSIDNIVWSAHSDLLQLDCTFLEPLYLGKNKLSIEETAQKWDDMITGRLRLLDNSDSISKISLGDGGMLQDELDSALAVVHRASFISRSIQKNLIGHLSKDDNSPVTIADFAVQALVVYYLNKAFPNDKFIAEENSVLVREDKGVRDDILRTLRGASEIDWDEELLFNTIDKGGFDGSAERVWVLDPVDGTKGFMRGEHYCIALALLINGIPSLSVMGCPNLHLENVLEPKIGAKEVNGLTGSKNEVSVSFVEESVTYPAIGNYFRSLVMPYWTNLCVLRRTCRQV
jgi:hypothetical protein